jgi:hypothetical protein
VPKAGIEATHPAIIARFSFDVPLGRKSEFFELKKKWAPIGKELAFPQPEVLVGSIPVLLKRMRSFLPWRYAISDSRTRTFRPTITIGASRRQKPIAESFRASCCG